MSWRRARYIVCVTKRRHHHLWSIHYDRRRGRELCRYSQARHVAFNLGLLQAPTQRYKCRYSAISSLISCASQSFKVDVGVVNVHDFHEQATLKLDIDLIEGEYRRIVAYFERLAEPFETTSLLSFDLLWRFRYALF